MTRVSVAVAVGVTMTSSWSSGKTRIGSFGGSWGGFGRKGTVTVTVVVLRRQRGLKRGRWVQLVDAELGGDDHVGHGDAAGGFGVVGVEGGFEVLEANHCNVSAILDGGNMIKQKEPEKLWK